MWKIALIASFLPAAAMAGQVDILFAKAIRTGSSWEIRVTLRHKDTGWDHYADRWDVRLPDGTVAGTRVLLHPHEREQPFTRGLSGVRIPDDVSRVEIHAHDNVHGWSEDVYVLNLREP